MSLSFEDPAERDRRRWTRENAHLWMRPDAHRFMRPDAARFMRPDAERVVGGEVWRHPDEKFWEFQTAHEQRGTSAAARGSNRARAAELVRLQAEHDFFRRAVLQLQQERRRKLGLEQAEAERLKRKSDAAWEKFIDAFSRHWNACCKALHPSHYNPDQPRVPAGNPAGGRWTSEGGGAGGGPGAGGSGGGFDDPRVLSDAAPDNDSKPGAQYAQAGSEEQVILIAGRGGIAKQFLKLSGNREGRRRAGAKML
jgi:hypothetical protein